MMLPDSHWTLRPRGRRRRLSLLTLLCGLSLTLVAFGATESAGYSGTRGPSGTILTSVTSGKGEPSHLFDTSGTRGMAAQGSDIASKRSRAYTAAPPAASASHPYYVSPEGNDHAGGTAAHPWATLQHAVDAVPGGAVILLDAGVYHQAVTIERNGFAHGRPLVIEPTFGQRATLDGSGAGAQNEGLINIDDSAGIVIRGLSIRDNSTASPNDTPMGIEVSGYDHAIMIVGNHISDIDTTVSTSDGNAQGIGVYGTATQPITDITIADNRLDHMRLGASETIAINGNVDGFQVTGNLVYDSDNIGIDAIGFEGTAPTPALDRARSGIIAHNTVYGISSWGNPAYGDQYAADGIYVDGGTQIQVLDNRVYDCDYGVEFASEHHDGNTSHITMVGNLVYDNRAAGLSVGGYDDKRGFTADCLISHNTFYHNDSLQGSGQIAFAYEVYHLTITRNIIDGLAGDELIGNPFTQNEFNTVNDNLYWSPAGPQVAQFQWRNQDITGFDVYRMKTGNDRNSRFADPTFADPSSGNFTQTPNSPGYGFGAGSTLAPPA